MLAETGMLFGVSLLLFIKSCCMLSVAANEMIRNQSPMLFIRILAGKINASYCSARGFTMYFHCKLTKEARMNQHPIRLLSVFAIILCISFSSLMAQEKALVCVLPLSAVSIKAADAQLFTEAIQRKLENNSKFTLIPQATVRDSIKKIFGDVEGKCSSEECLIKFGKQLNADYVLSGSLGQIGALLTLNIKFIDIQNGTVALTKEYQGKTSIEYFYQKSPERVAADLSAICFPGSTFTSSAPAAVAPQAYQPPPQPSYPPAEPYKPEPASWAPVSSDSNYGLVQAPSIGFSGNITFIDPTNEQSLYGLQLMYVHPTGAKSQARIIAGFPMANSKSEIMGGSWRAPDPQISIEEEWGMERFGISIGLSYMYLHSFDKLDSGFYLTDYIAHFPVVQTYNYVFGIRGGRPNAGFKGRISWPTPWSINTDKPANYMFEYSAMGVFGTRTFKGGIGIAGMYKQREVARPNGGSMYYIFNDYVRVSQYHRMFPCGRVAFMAGQQTVIGISADFFGLLFPREGQSSWWGAPSIGLQFLYSFAPLHGANLVDGMF
jgi:TolB-like protein